MNSQMQANAAPLTAVVRRHNAIYKYIAEGGSRRRPDHKEVMTGCFPKKDCEQTFLRVTVQTKMRFNLFRN
eukprot:1139110-Amphidinium_carterae.1